VVVVVAGVMVAGGVEVAVSSAPLVAGVVDASAVGTIEGAAAGSMMTVRVDVAVRPDWSAAT